MEQKNKKTFIIVLLIINFLLFAGSLLFGTSFLLINRGGYCEIKDVFFDLWRFESLVLLALTIIVSFKLLYYLNKNSRESKKIRFLVKFILVVSSMFFTFILFVIIGNILNLGCTGREVSIKANLYYLRTPGREWALKNENNYIGFCNGVDTNKIKDEIIKNKSEMFCVENRQFWAVCAQLKRGIYYCNDSTNINREIKGICDENWKYTQCPI